MVPQGPPQGGHRVPALLHWPGRLLPRREAGLVSMLDLAPTLAALAGGSLPSAGLDLAPALLAGTPSPREEVASMLLFPPRPPFSSTSRWPSSTPGPPTAGSTP